MDVITLEGVDGTGKSTVHKGFLAETVSGQSLVPGIVERLRSGHDRPVIESREPGSYHRDGPDFQAWGPLSIERPLNTATKMLGIAYLKTEDRYIRRILDAAAFTARHDTMPDTVYEAVLKGAEWPEAFRPELQAVHDEWLALIETLDKNPILRRRIVRKYNCRDAIRHALINAHDSDQLNPTASGLMFFAGHMLHGEWLAGLDDDAIAVSDRAAESNLAYGPARGDDPRIEELYRRRRPFTPDLVVLLTADLGTIAERTGLREDDANKSWDDLTTLEAAQDRYLEMADEEEYPFVRVDTTDLDPQAAIEITQERINQYLSAHAPSADDDETAEPATV